MKVYKYLEDILDEETIATIAASERGGIDFDKSSFEGDDSNDNDSNHGQENEGNKPFTWSGH